ncbi:MAG: MaoC family dehydratase [Phyllobacteriaceae bacterium]|jgi:acyl dehydratase|nr:MaoC family dehydratase [Phyllobacteriaceae bacterium]
MAEFLHFEDFAEGARFPLGPHTVTRDAIIAFAQEFDPQPFHLDEEAAKASILGELAASGWHSTAMLMRLMCDACLSRSSILGSSGMDEVKWLSPVLAGDVLSGDFTITSTRASASRPGIGIVNFTSKLAGADGTPKIEMTGMFFMRRRAL